MKNKFNLWLFITSSIKVRKYHKNKYRFLSDEETINKIVNEGCSLTRYGDGEFKWMMRVKQNSFQNDSKELSRDLIEVIHSNNPKLLVGIPHTINNTSGYNLVGKYYWNYFMCKYYHEVSNFLDMNRIYADAMITRPYMDYKNKKLHINNFSLFKRVWDKRNVILLEGCESYWGLGSDLLSNANIKRIICPNHDAYFVIDKIYDSVIKNTKPDDLILIALGPTASILSYKLCNNGYQAIDIGHLDIEYAWYLKNAIVKTSIKGKNVNEGIKGISIDIDIDKYKDEYNKEIIDRINLDEKDS